MQRCPLCFSVHIACSPRQYLSRLLGPKRGPNLPSATFIVQSGPPSDHYQPLRHDEIASTGYWSVFSAGTGGVWRGCAMGGGVPHSWRQMSSLLLSTERLLTPPNTNTDTCR